MRSTVRCALRAGESPNSGRKVPDMTCAAIRWQFGRKTPAPEQRRHFPNPQGKPSSLCCEPLLPMTLKAQGVGNQPRGWVVWAARHCPCGTPEHCGKREDSSQMPAPWEDSGGQLFLSLGLGAPRVRARSRVTCRPCSSDQEDGLKPASQAGSQGSPGHGAPLPHAVWWTPPSPSCRHDSVLPSACPGPMSGP